MLTVATREEYLNKLLNTNRPGLEDILAFYDHRLGIIGKDPRFMLIPLDDHLVHRGDGVFETLKFADSRVYQLDAHLKRMASSCATIYLSPPCSWDRLQELILEVVGQSGSQEGVISVFVGRGPGGMTVDFRECPESSLYIVLRRLPYKPESFWEKGVTAFKALTPTKQSYLSKIKSVDYLPNVLMKREAILQGYDYPFCFDEQGYLAEGATENVCILNSSGQLVIPESRNALMGTTLIRAITLIQDEVPVTYQAVSEADIYKAREVIVLGTTIDAVGVVRFNGQPVHDVRPGPVAKRIRELLINDRINHGIAVD